jgi:hypothetical protein
MCERRYLQAVCNLVGYSISDSDPRLLREVGDLSYRTNMKSAVTFQTGIKLVRELQFEMQTFLQHPAAE